MSAARWNDRDDQVEEYLQLLRSLAYELERAMRAITRNALSEFEDSLANQQVMSERLTELATALNCAQGPGEQHSPVNAEDGLMLQIQIASAALQSLNHRYAALIAHSSRSVAMMVSLFNSFKGNLQEVPGARPELHTWSCQV